jgi:hypothetical protein
MGHGVCDVCGRASTRPPAFPQRRKLWLKLKVYFDANYSFQRVYCSALCLHLDQALENMLASLDREPLLSSRPMQQTGEQ